MGDYHVNQTRGDLDQIDQAVRYVRKKLAHDPVEFGAVIQTMDKIGKRAQSVSGFLKREQKMSKGTFQQGGKVDHRGQQIDFASMIDEDEDEAKPFADEGMEAEAGAPDAAGLLSQATEMLSGLMDVMQQLADQMGADEPAEEAIEAEDMVEDAPPVMASSNTPVEVRQADADTSAGKIAALEAQLAAFQAQAQEAQVQSERDQEALAFSKAGASDADVDTFRALWKNHGPGNARAFAESMTRSYASRPAPPPRTFAGDLPADAVNGSGLPEEVLAYQAQGPEKFAEAQRWFAAWQRGSKRHSLKTYLDAQLDAGQFFTAGAGRI